MPAESDPQLAAIRAFLPADAEACAAIFHRAWAQAFPHLPRYIDQAVFERETRGEQVRVAVRRGAVAGFAAIYRPEAFVHHLYVDPTCHGRGIGRALLADAVVVAGGSATLKCQLDNPGALRFYRAAGWSEAERGVGLHGPWVRLASPG